MGVLVKADDPVRDVIEEKREVLKQTLVHMRTRRFRRGSPGVVIRRRRAKMCLARKECFECKG